MALGYLPAARLPVCCQLRGQLPRGLKDRRRPAHTLRRPCSLLAAGHNAQVSLLFFLSFFLFSLEFPTRKRNYCSHVDATQQARQTLKGLPDFSTIVCGVRPRFPRPEKSSRCPYTVQQVPLGNNVRTCPPVYSAARGLRSTHHGTFLNNLNRKHNKVLPIRMLGALSLSPVEVEWQF